MNELLAQYRECYKLGSNQVKDILNRGIANCYGNPSNGVLVVGINPSDDKIRRDSDDYSFTLKDNVFTIEKPKGLWKLFLKIFNTQALRDKVGYLDLFPIRCTSQKEFDIRFKNEIQLKVALLKVTQQEIERLKPKVILILNNGSEAYWGVLPKFVWMGYQFTSYIEFGRIRLDIITGMREERILPELQTNLIGTKVIWYGLYDHRHIKDKNKDKELENDRATITKWISESLYGL
ncbi:MAG: hypothetical protein LIP09_03175 [Bacteroidales bacterium]|nr:hypothetical protein [Bacteroidales bacterium]